MTICSGIQLNLCRSNPWRRWTRNAKRTHHFRPECKFSFQGRQMWEVPVTLKHVCEVVPARQFWRITREGNQLQTFLHAWIKFQTRFGFVVCFTAIWNKVMRLLGIYVWVGTTSGNDSHSGLPLPSDLLLTTIAGKDPGTQRCNMGQKWWKSCSAIGLCKTQRWLLKPTQKWKSKFWKSCASEFRRSSIMSPQHTQRKRVRTWVGWSLLELSFSA